MKKIVHFLFFMLILSACVGSSTGNPAFPKLTIDTGWVVDTTGTLDSETEQRLESLATQMKELGFQVGIGIFPDCNCEPIIYATDFGNHNGLGSTERDNGLAIVVFVDKAGGGGEKPAISIATGSGLGGLLTDGITGRILDATFVPARSSGQWQQGMVDLLTGLKDFLSGSKDISQFQTPPPKPMDMTIVIIVVVIIVVFFAIDGILFRFAITLAILEAAASSTGSGGSSSGGSGGSSSLGGGGSFSGGGASR